MSKFLAIKDSFGVLRKARFPANIFRRKTDMTNVLNFKLILHSIYGISNLRNDTLKKKLLKKSQDNLEGIT